MRYALLFLYALVCAFTAILGYNLHVCTTGSALGWTLFEVYAVWGILPLVGVIIVNICALGAVNLARLGGETNWRPSFIFGLLAVLPSLLLAGYVGAWLSKASGSCSLGF